MSQNINGTFTGTGASGSVRCRHADISLSFGGTATVQIQRSLDNGTTWTTIETHDASTERTYEGGTQVDLRLNCSAHTNDVTWSISSDGGW